MNTRNIQTFLMVSAAFFAMSAPVRSGNAGALANAVSRTAQIAAAPLAADRVARAASSNGEEQNS